MRRVWRTCLLFSLCLLTVECLLAPSRADVITKPAVLDPSTPARQSVFTLLSIQTVSDHASFPRTRSWSWDTTLPDSTAVWIRVRLRRGEKSSANWDSDATRFSPMVTDSMGDSYRPKWVTVSNGGVILIRIPSGYSGAVKHVDLKLHDSSGHTAVWRLTHLPTMGHLINKAPPQEVATKTIGPITVKIGSITTQSGPVDPSDPQHGSELYVDAIAYGNIPKNYRWLLTPLRITPEWWPSGDAPLTDPYDRPKSAMPMPGAFDDGIDTADFGAIAYPAEQNYVRVDCDLIEKAICKESAVFRHVAFEPFGGIFAPKAGEIWVAATPDGLALTLRRGSRDGGEYVDIRSTQNAEHASLPRSPLYTRWKLPLVLSMSVNDRRFPYPSIDDPLHPDDQNTVYLYVNQPSWSNAEHFADIEVTVQESAFVKSTPIDTTVKVRHLPVTTMTYIFDYVGVAGDFKAWRLIWGQMDAGGAEYAAYKEGISPTPDF